MPIPEEAWSDRFWMMVEFIKALPYLPNLVKIGHGFLCPCTGSRRDDLLWKWFPFDPKFDTTTFHSYRRCSNGSYRYVESFKRHLREQHNERHHWILYYSKKVEEVYVAIKEYGLPPSLPISPLPDDSLGKDNRDEREMIDSGFLAKDSLMEKINKQVKLQAILDCVIDQNAAKEEMEEKIIGKRRYLTLHPYWDYKAVKVTRKEEKEEREVFMAKEKERKTFMEKVHGEVETEVEKDGEKAVKRRVEELLVAKEKLHASEGKYEKDIHLNNKTKIEFIFAKSKASNRGIVEIYANAAEIFSSAIFSGSKDFETNSIKIPSLKFPKKKESSGKKKTSPWLPNLAPFKKITPTAASFKKISPTRTSFKKTSPTADSLKKSSPTIRPIYNVSNKRLIREFSTEFSLREKLYKGHKIDFQNFFTLPTKIFERWVHGSCIKLNRKKID